MYKVIKLFLVLGIFGLVSACNSTFRSDVTRFHELPEPRGESIVIVAADPAKNTSLEFASYANIVGGYLAKQGYVPAKDGKPDLIVALDYSIDDGKVMIRDYGPHFSFGYGYGYGYGYSGYYDFWDTPYSYYGYGPYFGSFYSYGDPFERHMSSYVTYTRKLNMTIRPNKPGVKNIFEGTVESTGRGKNLTKIMPHMVQALFTNFPGVSGATDKIVIELDKE